MIETRTKRLISAERSDVMSMDNVLVIDRATGAFSHLRDEEPIKLRVCRGCGRVHAAPAFCAKAA
jgi:hypothetical protein